MEHNGRPFRGSIAVAKGRLTRAELRSGRWRSLFTDVCVDAATPVTQLLRIRGAALRLPVDAVITGRSAAIVWGVRMGSSHDSVEVLSMSRISAAGITARTGTIDESEVLIRHDVRVPSLLHTAWEIARMYPPDTAVPWIDQLIHRTQIETTDLLEHAAAHRTDWRSTVAVRTLAWCDWRAESPPESTVRLALVTAGVRAPQPQLEVHHNGILVARVDLGYEDIKLALEYDGQWHADKDQLTRDRRRIRSLNAAGWYVYPITRDDLHNLDRLVETIRHLIESRERLL